jgi:hypothetical protein
MRKTRLVLFGAFLLAMLGGSLLVGPSVSVAQRAEERNYWRHHDGRWSHWDSRDKRWYYTDGSHWFYHTGKAWTPYRFDRTFGKDFERGTYVVPAEGATVVVPTHGAYVPR